MTTKKKELRLNTLDQNIQFVHNQKNELTFVQIPYPFYVQLIAGKRTNLLTETTSESEVGYEILRSSIKDLQKKGLTLEKIATHLGVKQPYLSKILSTKRLFKASTLARYLKKLDVLE